MEDVFIQFIKPLIEALAGNYGKAAQVLAGVASFMGIVRIVFKPIMTALHEIAVATESKYDDELLGKVESSKAFKIFSFFVDYILSIKLPKKE